jgi:two-component system CheB/CheR fusion protein
MLASHQHDKSASSTAPIFGWLRSHALLDVRGYAIAPLRRRLLDRMVMLNVSSANDYVARLERDADERVALVAELLGSRSAFGTDAGTLRALAAHLASSRTSRSALRGRFCAWSAGCATGEEPYTLAMIFAEALGLDALGRHVDILATDIDPRAIEIGTAAVYDATSLSRLPPATVSAYFDDRDGRYVIKDQLRVVRFLRHDLLRDEAPRKMDLVVCRDLAPFFSAAGRRRATRSLVRALRPGALLVLGRGEWPELGSRLETLDAVRGIYRRVDDGVSS